MHKMNDYSSNMTASALPDGIFIISGLRQPSKYLKRKHKAIYDNSISSEDDPSGFFKKRMISDEEHSFENGFQLNHNSNDSLSSQELHRNFITINSTCTSTPTLNQSLSSSHSTESTLHSDDASMGHVQNVQRQVFKEELTSDTSSNGQYEFSNSESFHAESDRHSESNVYSEKETTYSSSYSEKNNQVYSSGEEMNRIPENSQFAKLRRLLQKDKSNRIIDCNFVVSEAEALLAVLKLCNENFFTQTAVADEFKMLNNFFGSKLFPSSRYLVDQLFNCNDALEYHALCPQCHKYVGKFDRQDRNIKCALCNINISLKSSTYTDFFVIINIEHELIDLLEENSESFQSIISSRMNDKETFNEFVDGICYKEFMQKLPATDRANFVSLTINSDGSPVFKSSKFSVWPIQAIVNELPFDVKIERPLKCGFWFGKTKPDMNILLDPFVDKMRILSNEGINCRISNEETNIKVFVLCWCVDSGARPGMQGLVQYNGYYGCPWCLHEGVYIVTGEGKGCVKFPLLEELPRKRSADEMLNHMRESITSRYPVFGVKRPSALINLPGFDIVDGFVPDPLHQANKGLGEQFLDYWDSSGEPYSLSRENIEFINACLTKMKAPIQVHRLTRSIDEKSWWNAIEYENWILHYSVPIILAFPHMKTYVEHWMLFVGAYHTLLKSSITKEELMKAHNSLIDFVKETEILYLPSAMTFNVHQTLHLVQSVVNWGPLFDPSTYCFETGNGQILKTCS